jgi:hypothetical protein
MRSFIWAIAATLSLGVTSMAAAQNATALILSCTGTITDKVSKRLDKVRIGVIVNFQTKQVTGLSPNGAYDADIISVSDSSVYFYTINDQLKTRAEINGHIDRITGSLEALV